MLSDTQWYSVIRCRWLASSHSHIIIAQWIGEADSMKALDRNSDNSDNNDCLKLTSRCQN